MQGGLHGGPEKCCRSPAHVVHPAVATGCGIREDRGGRAGYPTPGRSALVVEFSAALEAHALVGLTAGWDARIADILEQAFTPAG